MLLRAQGRTAKRTAPAIRDKYIIAFAKFIYLKISRINTLFISVHFFFFGQF